MVLRQERYETGGPRRRLTVGKVLGRVLTVLVTCVVAVAIVLAGMCFLVFRGPSGTARDLVVTTLLEVPVVGALPKVFLTDAQIKDILARNSMAPIDVSVEDPQLVDFRQELEAAQALDKGQVELQTVEHATFTAHLLVVNDPSRVRVAVPDEFSDKGLALTELSGQATAAIGAGLTDETRGSGGYPVGVIVANGKVKWMDTSSSGLYLVGLDDDNLLRIIDVRGKTDFEVEQIIMDEHIREAVTTADEVVDLKSHLGPLMINGVVREYSGTGSGEAARCAIGQRSDGALLILTCSGDLLKGKAGATAEDLISILSGAGAVNACALSEGPRAQMIYEDQTLVDGTGIFVTGGLRLMPSAFVVEAR